MCNCVHAQREADGRLMLSDMPDDTLREILLRLEHHRDVASMSAVDNHAYHVAQDEEVWKCLCLHHFSQHLCGRLIKQAHRAGWKDVYRGLIK